MSYSYAHFDDQINILSIYREEKPVNFGGSLDFLCCSLYKNLLLVYQKIYGDSYNWKDIVIGL